MDYFLVHFCQSCSVFGKTTILSKLIRNKFQYSCSFMQKNQKNLFNRLLETNKKTNVFVLLGFEQKSAQNLQFELLYASTYSGTRKKLCNVVFTKIKLLKLMCFIVIRKMNAADILLCFKILETEICRNLQRKGTERM